MDTIVDRYFPALDALTEEIEGIEERIFAGKLHGGHHASLAAMVLIDVYLIYRFKKAKWM